MLTTNMVALKILQDETNMVALKILQDETGQAINFKYGGFENSAR